MKYGFVMPPEDPRGAVAHRVDVRMSGLDRFGQYLAALEIEEQARATGFAAQSVGFTGHSGVRFEQYLWAIQQ